MCPKGDFPVVFQSKMLSKPTRSARSILNQFPRFLKCFCQKKEKMQLQNKLRSIPRRRNSHNKAKVKSAAFLMMNQSDFGDG